MQVFLDANVLFSIRDADLLLTLAEAGLFELYYSAYVEDEAIRKIVSRRPDLDEEDLRRRFDNMRDAFAASYLADEGDPPEPYGLPDPEDERVMFDAIRSGATRLLTYNLEDFPDSILRHHGLTAESPKTFVNAFALGHDAAELALVIDTWRRTKTRPPISRDAQIAQLRARDYGGLADKIDAFWRKPKKQG